MNLATPLSTGIDESFNASKWRPMSAVGAATDAASSPQAITPMQYTGPSPPFGVDPPRPPRDGQEAVRVSTPPMDEDTADGKPRGFFGPLTPPPEPDSAGSQIYLTPKTSLYASPRYNAHRMSIAVPSREWWEGNPQKPSRHGDTSAVTKFEFDVPEHLPNSPMCPANERHKSGGTGLCVYHGRRRALSTVRDEGHKRQASNSTS
ncbi:hypothetical protein V2A60_001888 [Cordyceps javanica]